MNRRKQSNIDLGLLRNFFHSKLNIWVIASSSIITLCICLYFFSLHNVSFFPAKNDFKVEFYTDSVNGGNSLITWQNVSDSIIEFEFDLKEGFLSPYVGFSITPNSDGIINLSHYNLIHLNIEGQRIESVGVSLYTHNPNKNLTSGIDDLCFYTILDISPERKQYYINLDQLKVPDWWSEVYKISPDEKIAPNLKKVLHLNIGTAYTPILGTKRLLKIHSISFERNNSGLMAYLIIAELIIILVLILVHYLNTKLRKTAIPVTISYRPVDIDNDNQQLNGFLDYINSNFHECDLTLEQVSDHTGINQRRIANYIQQNFNCNFKTYINQIRINESKRMLKESELNMGEIAFKVGFNNQSHFNRVFKSLVGISPSEFRENKQ